MTVHCTRWPIAAVPPGLPWRAASGSQGLRRVPSASHCALPLVSIVPTWSLAYPWRVAQLWLEGPRAASEPEGRDVLLHAAVVAATPYRRVLPDSGHPPLATLAQDCSHHHRGWTASSLQVVLAQGLAV